MIVSHFVSQSEVQLAKVGIPEIYIYRRGFKDMTYNIRADNLWSLHQIWAAVTYYSSTCLELWEADQ